MIITTTQQAFNLAAVHLMTQKATAFGEHISLCAYRGANGTKCAVGCLIPDEEYSKGFEENTAKELLLHYGKELPSINQLDQDFLTDLQNIHDRESVDDWYACLIVLAERYNLDTTEFKSEIE